MIGTEKVDAWMPLWIGAYLADTTHLSRDEHGGYLLLLMAYWRNKGPLTDDGNRLANIVKATPAEWRRLRPVLVEFFKDDGAQWLHVRAEKELTSAGLHKAAAVSKAKAGAEARWKHHHKQCLKDAPSMPQALPEDMPKQCPTPSPSSIPSEQKKRKRASAPTFPPPDGVDGQIWADWLALRHAKRAPVTATVIAGAVAEAAKAGMTLPEFLAVWCQRGSQGLQAEWLQKPDVVRREAGATGEPEWRRAQRERNEAFLGPASESAAAARRAANTEATSTENQNVVAIRVG